MIHSRTLTHLFVVTTVLLLSACTVRYEVAGKFADHNEVFRGNIIHDLAAGQAQIEATGQVTGLKCSGHSWVTYKPFGGGCAGQRGEARLDCDDGRLIRADWHADSCTTGFGEGRDENGARFVFAFGLTAEEAQAYVDRQMPRVAEKASLPGYKPKEHRKEKGFSTGTGFFITGDGYLITNHHVIDGADAVAVKFPNGDVVGAKVVKSDPANDVALVKAEVEAGPIPLSQGDFANRGEEVMTLGYPLIRLQGQEQKATFGRINALSGLGDDIRFYQIDTPIQPGNSGGPLIDRRGRVVGIVTQTLNQIVSLKEAGHLAQNVNFAVKSDYIFPLLKSEIPADALPPTSNTVRTMAELASQYENSVVLVIAK